VGEVWNCLDDEGIAVPYWRYDHHRESESMKPAKPGNPVALILPFASHKSPAEQALDECDRAMDYLAHVG
jgi:hypothetical protein